MASAATIQCIGFIDEDQPVYCLFCGQRVVGSSADVESDAVLQVTPCPHTLFVATDEGGLEFYAPRMAAWAEEQEDEDDDEAEEFSVGERVKQVAIRNAVCIEVFQPMPSGMAAYFGFAPVVS